MHSPQQCDAQRQPVCSRRIFLGSALAASASVVAGALAGIVYGEDGIPAEWLSLLRGKDVIEECLF